MKILNLSYYINNETPLYGGKSQLIRIQKTKVITSGDNTNELYLQFPAHCGTHIDLPKHFSNSGKSLNDFDSEVWFFDNIGFIQCEISEFTSLVEELSPNIELLIWKSGFGINRGTNNYWERQPIIPALFANILRKRFPKLRVLGFDFISLTSLLDKNEGKKAHISFLIENEIMVIEDMFLNSIEQAPDKVIIAPLLIDASDGVPCTVYAVYL
jgi:arylformamidase